LMKSDTALCRTASEIVLYAVSFEDASRAIVHADGEVHTELTSGLAQDGRNARIKAEPLCGKVKLLLRYCPGALL
jgi:hypothetical protein